MRPRGIGMSPRDTFRRPGDRGWGPEDRNGRRPGPGPRPLPERPPPKPFKENKQLLNGNYRGALQEHLQREVGRPVNIIFNTSKWTTEKRIQFSHLVVLLTVCMGRDTA